MKYRSSQTGWVLIFILTPVIIFLSLAYVNQWGNHPLPFWLFIAMEIFLVGTYLLFFRLTIEFQQTTLQLSYGIGLIKLTFRMDALEKVEVIKTSWYYGLGIKLTPKGMLYSIHGRKAVKINFTEGGGRKQIMVGTPAPEKLKKALEENIK